MLNKIQRAAIISIFLPVHLLGRDISVQVGVNHSWLYYPEAVIVAENEFNPNLSICLKTPLISKNNFGSSFGVRLFSVGRMDKYDFGYIKGKVEIKHIYLSIPLQVDYTLISKLKLYLNLEPAVQVNTKVKNTGTNETNTRTNEMNRLNLFLGIGLNYRFNLGKYKLGIGGLVNYGIFRISKDEEFAGGSRGWLDWRAREILLNIEYIFQL